ncbi:MAG: hypothetical protein IIA44_02515 [Acidobacteria bacterium]|nr:hypothetical protein [Acidobacteriota bacterium]
MAGLATATPDTLGGLLVIAVTDYREGKDQRPRYLGETPLVGFDLGAAGRALVAPSGTEPKLKIYVDLRADAGDDWWATEERIIETAAAVATDLAAFMGF